MSRFISARHKDLTPYVPGEQPRDITNLIKLNTNELPFPPPERVLSAAERAAEQLNLYCDTESRALCAEYARKLGISPEQLIATNGSDEILYYAFLAYGDQSRAMAYPDITYGFYPVYADLCHIPSKLIPLKPDFSVDYRDYLNIKANVVIANPNAPTGIAIPARDIERIVRSNPAHIVIIDEAYVDFGGESCVKLIDKYENLLITHTFSKSRGLAGARLGFGIAQKARIDELKAINSSINPYNVNSLTQAAGLAALKSSDYYDEKIALTCQIRGELARALTEMGFTVLPSRANFLFLSHAALTGEKLYMELRARGILVRHFSQPRIQNFVRMSICTPAQVTTVLDAMRDMVNTQSERG